MLNTLDSRVRNRVIQNGEQRHDGEPYLETQSCHIFVYEGLHSVYMTDVNNRNVCRASVHTFGKDKEGFERIVR